MSTLLLLAASAGPTLLAQVVTTVVTFVLVLVVLKVFALGPILKVLDERGTEVSSKFEEIDKRLAEATALQKDYEERLRHIDDEARERQNKAVDEGRRIAQEIVQKARTEAEEIVDKAGMTARMELEKARVELRREVVEMTLFATGKLLDASLDDEKHRNLVDHFVTGLEKRA
jgi:F-type H+-transporting ATPase subunit b